MGSRRDAGTSSHERKADLVRFRQVLHRRALGRAAVRPAPSDRRPVAWGRDRRDRARRERRHRCGGRGGRARACRRLGQADRDRARAAHGEARRTDQGAGRRTRSHRGARRRQAPEAGPRGRAGDGALHGVLRRRGRQGDGRNHPLSRRLHGLHLARAAWGDRPYRAVELSDADRRAHRRRGARDGQRLRAEARGGSLPHFACARRSRARGGLSRRRAQCRARPRRRGGRGARRASRRAGISRSPARSRWARWCRKPRLATSRR